MTFASITFFCFFAVVLSLVWIIRLPIFGKLKISRNSIQKYILLVASYIFYGWWDWRFCFLLFALTFIAYIAAKNISKNRRVKLNLFVGVFVPLLALGVFKYFNFFVDTFVQCFRIENYHALNIILPVGISFYTFQSLSYTIDVYRKDCPVCDSLSDLALYISFFPQLVAGPIVKASDFVPQLSEDRYVTLKKMGTGLQIFLIGLFKKMVVSDNLSVFVDEVFDTPNAFSSLTVLLGVVAYSIQIYFDFSGYTDMAIGCAHCLGYELERNFNLPYLSQNVSEFWKRWHISLSTWLMEYLYIPLGGNRKGKARTYFNLMATMVLGGLWHGASWNFVLWGTFHGAALCVHKIYLNFKKSHGLNKTPSKAGKVISAVLTYMFVCFCWVFFRASDFETATAVIGKMFIWSGGVSHFFVWVPIAVVVVIGEMIFSYFIGKNKTENTKYRINSHYLILDITKFRNMFIVILFAGIILALAYTGSNPFIYFQF